MAFEGLAQGRKWMCIWKPDAIASGTWCGFVAKTLLKSREIVLQTNGGWDCDMVLFGVFGVVCLFVFNSPHFWLQRYFFLDRGILKYSKCRADVSDPKPFKAIIRWQHYFIQNKNNSMLLAMGERVSAVLNSRGKGGKWWFQQVISILLPYSGVTVFLLLFCR